MENEINLIWNQVRKSLTCLNGQQVDLVGHVLKFLAKFLDVALDAGGQQAHVVGHRVDGLRSKWVQLDLSSLHITPQPITLCQVTYKDSTRQFKLLKMCLLI